MIDVLMKRSIPVTIYSSMLFFTHSNKPFILDGDLLKAITKYKFSVTHSNPQDQKLIYQFRREMNFDINLIAH